MMQTKHLLALIFCALLAPAQELPGTRPLPPAGDQAALMLDGIHSWLDRQLAASPHARNIAGTGESREALRLSLGMQGNRVPNPSLDYHPFLGVAGNAQVFAARWPVLREARAELWGEGLYMSSPAQRCAVVLIPDAGDTPEQLAGLAPGIAPERQYGRRLAAQGCSVVIPLLIDRASEWSGNPRIRMTNQPHREFIHRMAYQMGRHIIGYEIEKVLAAVDWLSARAPNNPVGVFGQGEGGLLALYAGALDQRLRSVAVSGYFGPRESVWQEPIYRNVWGLLTKFGDAELAKLVSPRALTVESDVGPEIAGPPPALDGRRGAATGAIRRVSAAEAERELQRAGTPQAHAVSANPSETVERFVRGLGLQPQPAPPKHVQVRARINTNERQQRQFDQMVEFTQALVRASGEERKQFWSAYNPAEPATLEPYREQFADWIGRLPVEPSTGPVQSRQTYDTAAFRGYEVKLPVTGPVFAYGILLVPKDLRPGERRPLVVAQHGLEGRPQLLVDASDNPKERETYREFAARLAERGYIVYAPQNPYILGERFRQAQRKANPLGLSLFSFIVAQHARTLDWLKSLPMVDPARIAFYGLSYGGFSAMRLPVLLPDYKAVICSGNFNEWTWKTTSIDVPFTYMFTGEYEIGEFAQGARFGHAEMARMIAPRPFMIERGHRDGVGIDEWIAYEFAKVSRHYRELGLSDRLELEYFDGVHRINGEGTFRFLDRWLNWQPRQ